MRISATIAAATLAVATTVVAAPAAHAALPMCDDDSFQYAGNGWYVQAPGV